MHTKNVGSTNDDSIREARGSSLNLSEGTYGIRLVDQWITPLCAFVCLSVDGTLRVLI